MHIRRRAYTTRRGVHVRSKLVKDMGAKGKWTGDGIGDLKEGELSKRGYSVTNKKTARHRALKKVVKAISPLSTFRKLNAIATYTKRTSKNKSKIFKTDRNWVKKTFMK
jgi:hypothetical protein